MTTAQHTAASVDLNALEITIPLSAHDPSSGRTWVIARPWDKLLDKYFTAGNFLSTEFDLYSARRAAADPEWRNRLEGADLTATRLMNSGIESPEVDAVLVNRSRIEVALRMIPTELHLADADLASEPLLTALPDLLSAFRGPKVGVAKTMKTLCQKRPRLLPMLDEFVRRALYNHADYPAPPLGDDPGEFARKVLYEIGLFRSVLLRGADSPNANHPRLVQLADALSDKLAEGYGWFPDLVTPVRVLDDLLWFEWHGHKHYGWIENETERRIEKPS